MSVGLFSSPSKVPKVILNPYLNSTGTTLWSTKTQETDSLPTLSQGFIFSSCEEFYPCGTRLRSGKVQSAYTQPIACRKLVPITYFLPRKGEAPPHPSCLFLTFMCTYKPVISISLVFRVPGQPFHALNTIDRHITFFRALYISYLGMAMGWVGVEFGSPHPHPRKRRGGFKFMFLEAGAHHIILKRKKILIRSIIYYLLSYYLCFYSNNI